MFLFLTFIRKKELLKLKSKFITATSIECCFELLEIYVTKDDQSKLPLHHRPAKYFFSKQLFFIRKCFFICLKLYLELQSQKYSTKTFLCFKKKPFIFYVWEWESTCVSFPTNAYQSKNTGLLKKIGSTYRKTANTCCKWERLPQSQLLRERENVIF